MLTVAAVLLLVGCSSHQHRNNMPITVNLRYSEDYMTSTEEAKVDIRNNARPELTASVENMDQYDTIILGYPIWWGLPPMAVYTFLASFRSILDADPQRFFRIHKSYVVNLAQIRQSSRSSVTMRDGKVLAVGETYRKGFNKINSTSNYMIFLIESAVAFAVFTLFVFLMSRDPIKGLPAALVAGLIVTLCA